MTYYVFSSLRRTFEDRGYFMNGYSLLNLSYGERKESKKKGEPVSMKTEFQKHITLQEADPPVSQGMILNLFCRCTYIFDDSSNDNIRHTVCKLTKGLSVLHSTLEISFYSCGRRIDKVCKLEQTVTRQ